MQENAPVQCDDSEIVPCKKAGLQTPVGTIREMPVGERHQAGGMGIHARAASPKGYPQ